jgi:hypothetical protein
LAAAVLCLATWLSPERFLALTVAILITSVALAALNACAFLENDTVQFGVIGGLVGLFFGVAGAGYGQSTLGGILLGALIGDTLRDRRREPLFAGQWRRRRRWHLISRRDAVVPARFALAVAVLAAFCPLVCFWGAAGIIPSGVDLNQMACEFCEHVHREANWGWSADPGVLLHQLLVQPLIVNWHVVGMLLLCGVQCFRLRRRAAESPVVELRLAHVSAALGLAMLMLASNLALDICCAINACADVSPKYHFFRISFWLLSETAPIAFLFPLVALALGPHRGRFVRNHIWLPTLGTLGLLNVVFFLVLLGCTFGQLG